MVLPLSRTFHVQLNALYVHRAPVFCCFVYLCRLLFLCISSVNFFSVTVTNKGCLDDRIMEIICFTEMCCLLLTQATDTVNIRILRVNNERG